MALGAGVRKVSATTRKFRFLITTAVSLFSAQSFTEARRPCRKFPWHGRRKFVLCSMPLAESRVNSPDCRRSIRMCKVPGYSFQGKGCRSGNVRLRLHLILRTWGKWSLPPIVSAFMARLHRVRAIVRQHFHLDSSRARIFTFRIQAQLNAYPFFSKENQDEPGTSIYQLSIKSVGHDRYGRGQSAR